MKTAAAVVKHRGVEVRIYGPLADRKSEVWLLTRHNGSRREKKTVKGSIEEAKRQAKPFAEAVSTGDAAMRLTPLQNRIFLTAQESASRTGRAVDALCREAAEAVALLPSGISLREAAAFYDAQHASGLKVATVAEVVAELLEFLERNKKRARVTVSTLKAILTPFASAFAVPITDVGTGQIESWLGTFRHAPRTMNNYRAAILRLFNFARGRYLPKHLPTAAERIEEISAARDPIGIFAPWEISSILVHAPDPLLPCIALGAFCGLRTCELTRIEWSAIRPDEKSAAFPEGYVEIGKAKAKQHRSAARRLIPIAPNLARWIEPYRFREGPVSPYRHASSLARAITAVIDSINEREARARRRTISRPDNGLRHSYASYRLPVIGSAAALAIEMNNSEAEIWRDYHKLAAPRDVETWWKIAPVDMPLFDRQEQAG